MERGRAVTSKLYDGLYSVAADGTMAPDLATAAPEHDDAATSWTVRIEDGVEFSDGTALDSEDVVATYRPEQRRPAGAHAGLP